MTGRDVKNIHEELTRLGNMGLIDLVEEGQSKRPIVWYAELDIKVPLPSSEEAETPAEA